MLHIGWDNLEEGFLQMHKVTSALCLLLSQVFNPVLLPPQAAHGDEPTQVQCRTLIEMLVGMLRNAKLSGYMKRKTHPYGQVFLFMESGNVLLSQVVSNQVPSALKGLTSVFGMGTGGSLSP